MIIGIQVGITSGVAVYENGKIIFAASEERYSRKKNDSNWPSRAIENAKKICNIAEDKIEKICLVSQKMTPVHFLCNIGGYSIEDYIKEQNEYYRPALLGGGGETFKLFRCFL